MSDGDKRGKGRPCLLTQSVIDEVVTLLPQVMYLESVGDYLGVSRQTWRGWLRRGRRERRRLDSDPKARPLPKEALYLQFFAATKKAMAGGEIDDARRIEAAAKNGAWQASAWRLERRFPDRWGKDAGEMAKFKRLLAEMEARAYGQPSQQPHSAGGAAAGAPGPGGGPADPVAGEPGAADAGPPLPG